MQFNLSKATSLFVAALLVMSVFAGSAAAWSAGSDVTSSTSQIQVDFDGNGSINVAINDTEASSPEDVGVRIHGYGQMQDATFTGIDVYSDDGATHDSTAGEYEWDINHTELADAPGNNGMYGVIVEVVNLNDNTTLYSQSVALSDADSGVSNAYVGDVGAPSGFDAAKAPLVADSVSIESKSDGGVLGLGLFGASNTTTLDSQGYSTINGTDSVLNLQLTGDAADAMSTAASGTSEGDLVPATMMVNNQPVLVYNSEAPSAMDNHTVATYDEATDTVSVEFGEEHADVSTVTYDISTVNGGFGFGTLSDELGIWSAFSNALPDISLPF
ncbi:hypothetical protein C478_07282 [Natrinema thermotolerans DSM 11552]|nr:hypothetical protein C478_07282 [Natrinema thermotolerans DSM 11552]